MTPAGKIGYVPGSYYKRFYGRGTNAQRMNRSTLEAYREQVTQSGTAVFDRISQQAQGRSELVAQQVVKRINAQAAAARARLVA